MSWNPGQASRHRAKFGDYGISVSEQWMSRHSAQPVIYVDPNGPVFEALKELFAVGYREVRAGIRYPEDKFWTIAYTNRATTSLASAPTYGNLLTLYEYMEVVDNSYQREWRVVNPWPLHGLSRDTSEVIANVSPPLGWAKEVLVVKVEPADVRRLICPEGELESLRSVLPHGWQDVQLDEHTPIDA